MSLSFDRQNGSAELGLGSRIPAKQLLRYKTPEFWVGLCSRHASMRDERPAHGTTGVEPAANHVEAEIREQHMNTALGYSVGRHPQVSPRHDKPPPRH